MAQLSKDSFAAGGPIQLLDDAIAAITGQLRAVEGLETVGLADRDGRGPARDLRATLDLPPFTNSAVDGYAIRGEDLPVDAERVFGVAARVQAGAPATGSVAPGTAVRVFTGAPMPVGADTVFMQEDVRVDDAGRAVL